MTDPWVTPQLIDKMSDELKASVRSHTVITGHGFVAGKLSVIILTVFFRICSRNYMKSHWYVIYTDRGKTFDKVDTVLLLHRLADLEFTR